MASEQLKLPCGFLLFNRLARNSVLDCFSNGRTNEPNTHHFQAYSCLANTGVAIMITSDVFIDRDCCNHPFALSLNSELSGFVSPERLRAFRYLAKACRSTSNSCMSLMQISHAGPFAPRSVTNAPLTPGFTEYVGFDGFSTVVPAAPQSHFSCLPSFFQPICQPRYMLTEDIGMQLFIILH